MTVVKPTPGTPVATTPPAASLSVSTPPGPSALKLTESGCPAASVIE